MPVLNNTAAVSKSRVRNTMNGSAMMRGRSSGRYNARLIIAVGRFAVAFLLGTFLTISVSTATFRRLKGGDAIPGMDSISPAITASHHEDDESATIDERWLELGGKLFFRTEPDRTTENRDDDHHDNASVSVRGGGKRQGRKSNPRRSCHRFDEWANRYRFSRTTKMGRLFDRCMEDLEESQRIVRHDFPELYHQNCSVPHALIHAMWNGPLKPTARLGIVSFVRAYPPGCVRVKLWTTDDASQRTSLSKELQPYVGDAVEVLKLDFVDLSQRIMSIHPRLSNLISSSKRLISTMGLPDDKGRHPVSFSDLVRVYVLAAYGGVYLDCDMLLLRPLTPLLSRDFYYRWSVHSYCNTAAMHLRLGSPNAAKLLRVALTSSPRYDKPEHALHPKNLYTEITKLNGTIERLPSAYFDPLWVITDVAWTLGHEAKRRYGLGSYWMFFEEVIVNADVKRDATENFFPGAFAFHWHNKWDQQFTAGSIADLFMRQFHENQQQQRQQEE